MLFHKIFQKLCFPYIWKNYIPVYCEITIFGWAMTFHKSRWSDEPQIKMSKNINSICIVQWFKTQSTKLMLNVHEYLYWRTTKCYAHVKKWLNSIQVVHVNPLLLVQCLMIVFVLMMLCSLGLIVILFSMLFECVAGLKVAWK